MEQYFGHTIHVACMQLTTCHLTTVVIQHFYRLLGIYQSNDQLFVTVIPVSLLRTQRYRHMPTPWGR